MKKTYAFIIFIAILAIAGGVVYFNASKVKQYVFKPTQTSIPPSELKIESEEVVAKNLNIPWQIVFLPDKSMLVTERRGSVKHVTNGKSIPVSGVVARGEGGLLGMTLHPDFASNSFIYIYSTTQTGSKLTNRVERYTYKDDQLTNRTVIIENIPGSANHDGGRIAFGPDKLLYITTGDAQNEKNAQDTNSLAGKILRLNDDGSIPAGNPFGNAVYSYGHRNPQGITWDSDGNLWATEHGPSAISSGQDELNLIKKGANYGWPVIRGDETQAGMTNPVIHSGTKDTWAPSGLTYYKGYLLFTGLRGEALYLTPVKDGNIAALTTQLRGKYGRLRSVVVGPDNYLYIATNNTDGRGIEKPEDDKIIRIKFNF